MDADKFANTVVDLVRTIGNVDIASSEVQPDPVQEQIIDMDVTIEGKVFNLIVQATYLRDQ